MTFTKNDVSTLIASVLKNVETYSKDPEAFINDWIKKHSPLEYSWKILYINPTKSLKPRTWMTIASSVQAAVKDFENTHLKECLITSIDQNHGPKKRP